MSSSVRRLLRSFALRTTLGFTAMLAAAEVILSVAVHWGLGYSLERELDEELEGDVREFIYHLTQPGWDQRLLKADLDHQAAAGSERGVFYRLFDASGNVLWTVPETRNYQLLPPPEAVNEALAGHRSQQVMNPDGRSRYMTLVYPATVPGGPVRACQVGMSMVNIERRLDKYALGLSLGGAVIVLLGAVVSYRLIRRPLALVREINQQARSITATALHLRLPEAGAGREFDELSATLNDMLARLEDSVGRLKEFTGDAAHELRSPLARMRVAAELALSGDRRPDELRETLAEMVEQTEELTALVDRLLLLAREDDGTSARGQETLDGRTLLEETLGVYQAVAEDKGLSMQILRADAGTVRGDRGRLLQAAGNLVENAVKFTAAGGSVRLSGLADGGEYRLEVRDTGCGIAPEDLPRVFDRFFRAERSRTPSVRGVGLGLSIVRAIAAAHGGRVEAVSQLGQGSTFTLILPLAL